MNESIISIAKQFKNASASAKTFEGFLLGEVVAPLPDIKIQTSDEIILDKSNLIFSAHVLDDYTRAFEIVEGNNLVINASTPSIYTAKGKIKLTDKLKNGDKLILIPSDNNNMYIVIDRAVML